MIQQNGNRDNLKDGPPEAWLGYSLLPEGIHKIISSLPYIFYQVQRSSSHFFSLKT